MSNKIEMTIDGRAVQAERGTMLLEAIRAASGEVPTLCHHPSLEPNGACRLCSVEITHPDWKGWSGLVTSCLYHVEPGLQVSTRSSSVKALRRTLLELYLSRCPEAEEIQVLARNEGLDASTFPVREEPDKCVLCGLCTRVCQNLGPQAIAPLSRGKDKAVGPNPGMVGEDCTCCGACALICPTDEIRIDRRENQYIIWNRAFDIPIAAVESQQCRGCGVCEEVCPVAVPRVQLFKNGKAVAFIAAEACTGCGICVGACPTGAIKQEACALEMQAGAAKETSMNGPVVFTCSRSSFPSATEKIVAVPCIGRVSIDRMLLALARGAGGVLLVCRDQATCPHGPGGCLGEGRARTAAELAELAGLGRDRIRYVRPAPIPEGPRQVLQAFTDSLKPNPLKETYAVQNTANLGMDLALDLMHWFKTRPELTPRLPESLAGLFDAAASGGKDGKQTVLYLGALPELDLLLGEVIWPWRIRNLVEDAIGLLLEKGMAFKPALTAREVKAIGPDRVVAFSARDLEALEGSFEKTTLDALAGSATVPGSKTEDTPGHEFRFKISQDERRAWMEQLKTASDKLCCVDPYALSQYMLLSRQGTWHPAFFKKPCMAFSEKVRAGTGRATP